MASALMNNNFCIRNTFYKEMHFQFSLVVCAPVRSPGCKCIKMVSKQKLVDLISFLCSILNNIYKYKYITDDAMCLHQ